MTITPDDKRFMKEALSLGQKGLGRTAPNPAVGAVVVRDGVIVGKGFHKVAGGPHAEVNALNDAGEFSKDATLYVTLEPCNHYGRTPPCTEAIIRAGIRRVVIGTLDPNPQVAGGGADYLRSKGVKVIAPCLEYRARALIAPFVKHIFTGLPWIRIKAASTLDGKIATATGDSKWITGQKAREYGHRLRDISCAILIGRGTVEADNPSLTCRLERGAGAGGPKDPQRIILDPTLALSPELKVFNLKRLGLSMANTIVFASKKRIETQIIRRLEQLGVEVILVGEEEGGDAMDDDEHCGHKLSIRDVLAILGERGIQSVLCEGGGAILGSLFDNGLVDEVFFFYAPKVLGGQKAISSVGGVGQTACSDAKRVYNCKVKKFGDDFLIHGFMKEGIYSAFEC